MLRQQLPRTWLFTDERLGDWLPAAIAALPRRSGIVFRHYGLSPAARLACLAQVRRAARRRGHLVLVAQPPHGTRSDGVHLPGHVARLPLPRPRLLTAAVHDMRERARATRLRADLLFVSPVFATASHPGAHPLGLLGLARIARRAPAPVVALGGLNLRRFRRLPRGVRSRLHGFAAIAGWAPRRPGQNDRAPPT